MPTLGYFSKSNAAPEGKTNEGPSTTTQENPLIIPDITSRAIHFSEAESDTGTTSELAESGVDARDIDLPIRRLSCNVMDWLTRHSYLEEN